MNQQPAQPGLFIGMDWADQKHDVYVIDRNGKGVHRVLEHSAENIEAWVGEMLKLAGGQPHRHHAGAVSRRAHLCAHVPRGRAALSGQSQAIGPLS